MSKSRDYVFTLNNYSEPERLHIDDVAQGDGVSYLLYGYEVGLEGTPHLQGFVQFKGPRTMDSAKRHLGCDRLHLEARRGSVQQCIEYCKKDGRYTEFGQPSRNLGQGTRTDLRELATFIRHNPSITEVAEEYPEMFIKYHKGISELIFRQKTGANRRVFRTLTVILYYGPAGSGKTRKAFEENPDCYILRKGNTGVWFDGYEGSDVLIIDDFAGWVSYTTLLNILDGYPLTCDIKGSHTWANWTKVIITSNRHWSEWYDWSKCFKPALERRIHECIEFQ